jgi:hypothetical protein
MLLISHAEDSRDARRRFARRTLLISLAEDSRDATHTRSTQLSARLVSHFAVRLDDPFTARLDAHLTDQA